MKSLVLAAAFTALATANPQIDTERSSARYERVTLDHDGGHTENLNLMVLTLKFTEPLHVDYNGSLTRIDLLPLEPNRLYEHPSQIPLYTYPLQQALGGAFRITAADEREPTLASSSGRRLRALRVCLCSCSSAAASFAARRATRRGQRRLRLRRKRRGGLPRRPR